MFAHYNLSIVCINNYFQFHLTLNVSGNKLKVVVKYFIVLKCSYKFGVYEGRCPRRCPFLKQTKYQYVQISTGAQTRFVVLLWIMRFRYRPDFVGSAEEFNRPYIYVCFFNEKAPLRIASISPFRARIIIEPWRQIEIASAGRLLALSAGHPKEERGVVKFRRMRWAKFYINFAAAVNVENFAPVSHWHFQHFS
jgi:hypothetical protein